MLYCYHNRLDVNKLYVHLIYQLGDCSKRGQLFDSEIVKGVSSINYLYCVHIAYPFWIPIAYDEGYITKVFRNNPNWGITK